MAEPPTHQERDADIREMEGRFVPTALILRQMRSRRKRVMWVGTITVAKAVKRLLDILVAAGMLVLMFPLFVLIGLCIWLTDRGPIIFSQKRVGLHGKEFVFPKFRSMVVNAEALKDKILAQNQHSDDQRSFKIKKDPRITWIGRIIRKLSLDEMPQLWCVLIGDMSLVGPRPSMPREVALFTVSDRRRLDVRPGLTCIWQVSGRADIPFDQQVKLDTEYIESQSLWLDIVLLFKTIPAVLLGRGAY